MSAHDVSETVLPYGGASGKFHLKKLSEISQRDLEWLLAQKWCKDPYRSKITEYLSVPPLTRALRKVQES
jgi:hypothetical protein